MSQQDLLESWLEKHGIKILDKSKRAHIWTKQNVAYFQYSHDYNMTKELAPELETERLYTVEISESELESLAKFEAQVFNNLVRHGHFNMFEALMEQKKQEQLFKDKYPAVKKAYEHYSLMLKMAESGEL